MLFLIAVPIGAWHALLPACLRSLSLQEGPIRVAVMDSSCDPRVCEALDTCGIEFAYRRHGRDAGQAAAIIEGWQAAGGEVLGWLNADDLLFKNTIKEARSELTAAQDFDAVHANSVIIDADGMVSGCHGQAGAFSYSRSPHNPVSQPSCFVRRSAVERAGGLNPKLTYAMDWDLWVRMARSGARFNYTPRYWSAVHWGPGTKTGSRSLRRVLELTQIAATLSVTAPARLLLGLATEKSKPGSALWRYAAYRSAAQPVSGVIVGARRSPREEVVPRAELRIPNVTDHMAHLLRVELEGGCALTIRMDTGAAYGPIAASSMQTIHLEEPCPPGGSVHVELESQDGRARVVGIQLAA